MNTNEQASVATPVVEKPTYLRIYLTDRAPIRIREDKWEVIASAKDWDNQYECQANRTWKLQVRRHDDGKRAVVYGWHNSQILSERDLYAGELVECDGAGEKALVEAIHRVASDCGCEQIAQDCIQDLPAETINGEPLS